MGDPGFSSPYYCIIVGSRAAVSSIAGAYRLGGAGLWIWLTGKLGRAWVHCGGDVMM